MKRGLFSLQLPEVAGIQMVFSDTTQHNISAFAATMGIRLHTNHKTGYGFEIAGQGVVSLTAAHDDRIIVSLTSPIDHWDDGMEERLFALAQSVLISGRLLSVGLNDKNMIFLGLSVNAAEISPEILNGCLQQLLSARAELM